MLRGLDDDEVVMLRELLSKVFEVVRNETWTAR